MVWNAVSPSVSAPLSTASMNAPKTPRTAPTNPYQAPAPRRSDMNRTAATMIGGTNRRTSRWPKWNRKFPRHSADHSATSVLIVRLRMYG